MDESQIGFYALVENLESRGQGYVGLSLSLGGKDARPMAG